MTSLQGVIKWSHEGDKIFIIISVKKMFYTDMSAVEAPLIQCDTEIDLICPLSVNPLMTSHGWKYRLGA